MTMKADEKKIVWWEKSVEYTFIAEMVRCQMFTWAAPLSGNAESALADALLQWDGKLLLIEFKRDGNTLKSEYEKYTIETDAEVRWLAYQTAKGVMSQMNGATGHGLVYGELEEGKLLLRAIPYWEELDPIDALQWCAKSGFSIVTDFDDYLFHLSSFRFATSDTSDGSRGSRSFVVGVGKSGKKFTVELEDYINLRPKLKKELEEKAILGSKASHRGISSKQ